MGILEETIEKIGKQQKEEFSAVWCVGEQLKDILRAQPELAEIVSADLDNKDMGLAACERKIRERADELHRKVKGNAVCVTPMEAERIIRKFYGLPERESDPDAGGGKAAAAGGASPSPAEGAAKARGEVVSLADFF